MNDSRKESPPTNPSAISRPALIWILAYILGGLLIIFNLARLVRISALLGQLGSLSNACFNPGANSNCTNFILIYINSVITPVILVILGAAVIVLRKKFIAQITAFVMLLSLAITLAPVSQYLVGAFLFRIIWTHILEFLELILAAIAIQIFPEPALMTRMQWPPNLTKRLIKAGVAAVCLGLIGAGIYWAHTAYVRGQTDKTTADNISGLATQTKTHLSNHQVIGAITRGELESKVGMRPSLTGFVICGHFYYDLSHGSPVQREYAASDLPKHKSGNVCYAYPVDKSQITVKDTLIVKDELVYAKTASSNVSVRPIDPKGNGLGSNDLSAADFVTKAGAATDFAHLRLGNTISMYYEQNLLTRKQSIYKVVVEDAGVYSGFCTVLLDAYQASPVSSCPGTVKGLTIKSVGSKALFLGTSYGTELLLSWNGFPQPSIYDANNKLIQITDLAQDEKIRLVFGDASSDQPTEIHVQ